MRSCLQSMRVYFIFLAGIVYSAGLQAQATTHWPAPQQDGRVEINIYYQPSNNAFGAMTQDFRITVRNNTSDKLHVYIDFYADLVCGSRRVTSFAPLSDGYILSPGQFINPTWTTNSFGYVRLLESECPKNTWELKGKDADGVQTYNLIRNLGYRINRIVNISEKERAEEAKKKREEEEKLRKKQEEETRRLKEEEIRRKQEEEVRRKAEAEKKEQEAREQQEKLKAANEEARKKETDAKNQQEKTLKQQREEEEERQRRIEEMEIQKKEQARLEQQKKQKAEQERIAKEDESKDICQRSYMITLSRNLEASYASYKKGQMPMGSRDNLIEEARRILFLCPYNLTAQNILNDLEGERKMASDIAVSIIEHAHTLEVELTRSVAPSDLQDLKDEYIRHDFSMLLKMYYGIPEISFVAGFGFSQEKLPGYTFTYENSYGLILPSDFPKYGESIPGGSRFGMQGAVGLSSTIPIIKNRRSDLPRLGLTLEGLGMLKWMTLNDDIIRSHFPDLISDWSWVWRGRAGLLVGISNGFGIALNVGMEQFPLKESTGGTINNLNKDGRPANVQFKAKPLNSKSLIPFFGLSLKAQF